MAGASIKDDELDEMLAKYSTFDGVRDVRLNQKIRVSNYQIRPQQIDPVTGLSRFTQSDTSTIFASPKQRLKVIPNGSDYPKVLMTTGAVTHPRYRDNRIGRIARLDHVYGALVVELDGRKKYHYRHIAAQKNGKFVDLGVEYDGKNMYEARPEAMVLGDWHTGETNPKVKAETFRMMEQYQPRRVFVHDFFNGDSISHHNIGKVVTQAKVHQRTGLDLGRELEASYRELMEIYKHLPEDAELVLIQSNHDEFLHRYLQSGRFIDEGRNALVASKLLTAYIEGTDPLRAGLEMQGDIPDNIRFLGRKEGYKVRGWELGKHGDQGANGARNSVRSTENALGKSISGHKHTPEIQRNTFIVGTSTGLDLEYMTGYSSWMNTHAMLYHTGRAQLVNVINGKHRQ